MAGANIRRPPIRKKLTTADVRNWMKQTTDNIARINAALDAGTGTAENISYDDDAVLPSLSASTVQAALDAIKATSFLAGRCWFGSGRDGALTVTSGTTTLTRAMYYTNVTISGTGSVTSAGWPIFISGTLDLREAPANALGRISTTPGGSASGTG